MSNLRVLLLSVFLLSINVLAAKIQYAVHVTVDGHDGEPFTATYWSSTANIPNTKAKNIANNMSNWSGGKFEASWNRRSEKVVVKNVEVVDDSEGIKDSMISEMHNLCRSHTGIA
ncbi:hypothetical protein K461DRAFT_291277 [Myriangium duriaei CBS 260.36]|uniref:Uncharacterized protein n=1 Tax=Myriangium duriaei CBS 260.36 TaxID=1168546 RepID=A0A9P4J7U6_9PEZI|nr:hypothetical protein K461DRAFT_291277 [Myriangium duriaei CBS 260.36]